MVNNLIFPLFLLCLSILATIVPIINWDWSCEKAIKKLKDSQREIIRARSELDNFEADYAYTFSKPSAGPWEDYQLSKKHYTYKGAKKMLQHISDNYDTAKRNFDLAVKSFEKSCLD